MRQKWKHFALFCLLLLFIHLASEDSSSKYWWQIELGLAVKGEYRYSKQQEAFKGFSGDYSFKIKLAAAMERDNGDYLLYKGEQVIEALDWQEILYRYQGPNHVYSLAGKIDLVLDLHYVLRLRKEGKIRFDFSTPAIPLPYGAAEPLRKIILPCSAENESLNPKAKYNNGIVGGSNNIELDDERIYRQKEVEKVFRWTWQRKKTSWSHTHEVEAKIKIIRQEKK